MTPSQHFLECATAGRQPGASTGERCAYRLAVSLLNNLGDLAGIDADAVDGFADLALAGASGEFALVKKMLATAVRNKEGAAE